MSHWVHMPKQETLMVSETSISPAQRETGHQLWKNVQLLFHNLQRRRFYFTKCCHVSSEKNRREGCRLPSGCQSGLLTFSGLRCGKGGERVVSADLTATHSQRLWKGMVLRICILLLKVSLGSQRRRKSLICEACERQKHPGTRGGHVGPG